MRVTAVFLAFGLCVAAQAQVPQQSAPQQATRQQAAPQAAPSNIVPPGAQQEQPVPVPSTPANMPPQPPDVTYQNGLLTIRAENSTLADVLTQVKNKIGAQIQVPPGASMERVVVQEGPAPPRTALASLLNGSGFDFVIVGSMQDPQSVERVMLTPHVQSAASPQPAYTARRSQPAPEYQGNEEEQNTSEEPTMPVPPQPAVNQPGTRPGQAQQPGQESGQTNNGPKTPEQLLQELQQIQRGQQQTPGQASQPQAPPNMPPRRVPMNPPNVP